MSSPLATFRKHRTYWMAGLVLLAIMAFVVAPLFDYMQGRIQNNDSGDQVVVRWNGGRFTTRDLERARQQHYKFVRFLSTLSREVLEAGGQPGIPEFAFSPESKQIIDLGVNVQSSNLAVIETRMLSDFAKSNGIEFDDDAADQFLIAFCDKCVSATRLAQILRESTDNQVTEFDLRELIKLELGAIVARQMALRGWSNDFKPDDYERVRLTQTPGDMWNDFLKLNQSVKVEAFPILVGDFVKTVTGEPSEAEILVIYEKGKNRIASTELPDPGFMRDYKANFEYVEGNFSEWIEKEKAKVTEDQLKAEYDKLIGLGQLKYDPLLDKAKAPSEPGSAETPAVGPETTVPAAPDAAAPGAPAQATPPPEAAAPDTTAPAPALVPESAAPAAPEGAVPQTPATTDPAVPAPKQQSSTRSSSQIRLISTQDDPKPTETPAAEPPATEPALAIEPAAVPPQTPPATEQNSFPDASLPPVVVQPGAPGAEAAAVPADTQAPDTKPIQRSKTFEEAKEELLDSLARTAVIDALQKELTSANEQMLKYANAHKQQVMLLKEGHQPEVNATRPDLRKVAEAGLKYGETGMSDRSKLFATALGKSTMSSTEQGMGQIPMPNYAMNPNYPLFTPAQSLFFDQMAMLEQRTPDFRQYIFWKTDEQQAYIPGLAEVREEVIAAWKTQKARQLAADEAAKVAKKIGGAEEPWKDALGVAQQSLVVTTDTFTWLSGFGETPRISNVPTLDTVGQEFMQKVFSSQTGTAGVAPNNGQNIYYVYRIVELTPPISELESRFAADPNKMAARRVGLMTGQQIYTGLYETIEDRLNVKWQISPNELDGQ